MLATALGCGAHPAPARAGRVPAPRIGMPAGQLSRLVGQAMSGGGARMASWEGDPSGIGSGAGAPSPFAVVYLADSSATLACRNRLLLALHPGEDGCLRAAPGQSLVPAAHPRRSPAPQGWSSLWDPVRFPGRRGLPRDPRGTLEVALLADGVPPSDIYRQLETPAGLDRAFRRLDQLRPYIAWWSSPAQAMELLRRGDVVMVAAPARDAEGRVMAGPAVPLAADWAIPAAQTPALRRQALALLDRLDGATKALSDSAPTSRGLDAKVSTAFWRARYTVLRQRFDAWLAAG
nr:extracellular solute-binding protein [Endobacter medicaginis]